MKKIGIASDHAGYEMKEFLVGYLNAMGYEVLDFGAHSPESVDYADFAHPLAEAIENGELERGVALAVRGEGMTMTLNKHQGIRAGLCWDTEIASLIRRHNDANIIGLPGRASSPTTKPSRCSTPISPPSSKADAISRASPRCPWRAANRAARSEEPETAEAGPLQHVADGIADALNEGRKADGDVTGWVRSGWDRSGQNSN